MESLPDFDIQSNGEISEEFLRRNIVTFHQALDSIRSMKYGRNSDRNKPTLIFREQKGTCSTKHSVLKLLADEHSITDIKLMLGIFRMNARNTPEIAETLRTYNIEYIPEAHTYLKYKNRIIDCTKEYSAAALFVPDLIEEFPIEIEQTGDFKVRFHKQYFEQWIKNIDTLYSVDEWWAIREQCISDLAKD